MMFRPQPPAPVRPGDIALVHFGECYYRRVLVYAVDQGKLLDGWIINAQNCTIDQVRDVKVTDVVYVYPSTSLL